jgi:hypothetical protein
MTILRKTGFERPVIDLTGPEGNAFCLLAYARRWGKELGKDTAAIHKEMTSGDYEHLLEVFDREFGEYADLLR